MLGAALFGSVWFSTSRRLSTFYKKIYTIVDLLQIICALHSCRSVDSRVDDGDDGNDDLLLVM